MLENAAESPASGACFVRRTHGTPTFFIDNEHQTHLDKILPTIKTLAITKKTITYFNKFIKIDMIANALMTPDTIATDRPKRFISPLPE